MIKHVITDASILSKINYTKKCKHRLSEYEPECEPMPGRH